MKKILLFLIIVSVSACSVDKSTIGKSLPPKFLELVPGEYILENKKVTIGSDGDIYENTTLLYEYIKEKSDTNTQAYYSMINQGEFVGLEVLPNSVVLYKKDKTNTWDIMKNVLFTTEHIVATPEELFKILIQKINTFYDSSIIKHSNGNFISKDTNYTYIELKNPMQAVYSVEATRNNQFVGITIDSNNNILKMYLKDKKTPWNSIDLVDFSDLNEFKPSIPGTDLVPSTPIHSWQVVGKKGFSSTKVDSINLAIDNNDIPYIAYRDFVNNKRAVVWTLKDDTTWIYAGRSPDASDDNITDLSLAIDYDGIPHITYNDSKSLIQFKKNSDKEWENIEAPSSILNSYSGKYIDLVISKNNVSYMIVDSGSDITIIKNNERYPYWSEIGSIGVDNPKTNLIITINDYGIPYISFTDTDTGNRNWTSIMKLRGTSWENVSGARVSKSDGIVHSLIFDNDNNLYIADQSDSKSTVKKFDGITWKSVGTLNFNSLALSLDIDNKNTPYVAYIKTNNIVGVQKFNGEEWEDVGVPTISAEQASSIKLVIDSKGIPYVAYNDKISGKITVMKYTKTP